jgi:uncharacterized membrane protein
MLSDYLIAPSLNSLIFTGIIILAIFIIFIRNFRPFLKLPYYDKLILLCSMSIAIGMHGMVHLGVETNYGFNPYNWF